MRLSLVPLCGRLASATERNSLSNLATTTKGLLRRATASRLAPGGLRGIGFTPETPDFCEMQALQFAIRPDALALGFQAKAAVGLVLAADPNVTVCGSHGVYSFWKHDEGQDGLEKQGERGRDQGSVRETR